MTNLYISAGHYGANSGAVQGIYQEAVFNKKFLEAITFGIKVPSGTLRSKIDWVNQRATPNDIAIEIHCNNSSAVALRGTEVYYRDEDDKKLAIELDNAMKSQLFLSGTINVPDSKAVRLGCDTGLGTIHHDSESYVQSLGWCRELKCPAVILEVEYMSNKEGLKVLLDPTTPQKVARAIRAVYDKYNPPTTSCVTQETEIKELKAKLTWFQEIFEYITKYFS